MKRSTIAAVLFAFAAAPVVAEDFSYTFVSAGYQTIDLGGADGDGLGVGGSFAIAENWHLFAGYQGYGFDSDVDLTGLNAGIGFNTPINESIDVVAQLSYVYAEVDTPFGSVDDNGYGIGVGLRAMAGQAVELNGSVSYTDSGDADGETTLGASFLYNFTENFAAGASGAWGDDTDAYGLMARFYF